MQTVKNFHLSQAITGRTISLRHDRPLVFVGTKNIPGWGTCMTADTCNLPICPGGCKYCFCALSIRSDKPQDHHYVRSAIGDKHMAHLIRAINIVKPNIITTAERIELGFCPDAIKELVTLRAGVWPETFMIFTTKFPTIWEQLDMPNTGMLVTLSNPRGIAGLEPHVPPYMDRVMGAHKAAVNAKHLKVGIRLLIMQREDIEYFRKAIIALKPYLDPNLIWADFLREPFVAKKGRLINALENYLDMSQFESHRRHGRTLSEDIMQDAAEAFAPYGVIFDRLPISVRQSSLSSEVRVIDTEHKAKCYVRADGSDCLRGASTWQKHTCTGRVPAEDNRDYCRCIRGNQEGGFCVNLTRMTLDQYQKTHDLWHWIEEVKAYAYGRAAGSGSKLFHDIMKTLHDPALITLIKKNNK